MADTVLIAPSDAAGALTRREDLTGAQLFSDADILPALDTIVRHAPRLIAVDRHLSTTPRGAALVERLRRDPALASCVIRLVGADASHDETLEPLGQSDAEAPPLDECGTRIAPRFTMRDDLDVMLDGRPARLIDLSHGGAQLVTPVAVKPQQRVRIALRAAETRLRLSATVQWANFEMPAEGPRYRAGVRFADAEPAALSSVIAQYRQ